MISYIKGKIIDQGQDSITLLAGVVGYKVFISSAKITTAGDDLELWIHPHIREDRFDLYGFSAKADMKLFEVLLTVSGVGPKMAQAIVSIADNKTVAEAIKSGDVAFLTSVSGVGSKLAKKIVIELGEKMDQNVWENIVSGKPDEVAVALKNLGFNPSEISQALKSLPPGLETNEQKIQSALKLIGKNK